MSKNVNIGQDLNVGNDLTIGNNLINEYRDNGSCRTTTNSNPVLQQGSTDNTDKDIGIKPIQSNRTALQVLNIVQMNL